MRKIFNNEMINVCGGDGVGIAIIGAIITGIVFIIGAIDGYINPSKCKID